MQKKKVRIWCGQSLGVDSCLFFLLVLLYLGTLVKFAVSVFVSPPLGQVWPPAGTRMCRSWFFLILLLRTTTEDRHRRRWRKLPKRINEDFYRSDLPQFGQGSGGLGREILNWVKDFLCEAPSDKKKQIFAMSSLWMLPWLDALLALLGSFDSFFICRLWPTLGPIVRHCALINCFWENIVLGFGLVLLDFWSDQFKWDLLCVFKLKTTKINQLNLIFFTKSFNRQTFHPNFITWQLSNLISDHLTVEFDTWFRRSRD